MARLYIVPMLTAPEGDSNAVPYLDLPRFHGLRSDAPAGASAPRQDEAGRLWDVVWMLRFAIRKSAQGHSRLPFALYVRNDNRAPRLVKLVAMCGALDIDDPQPAITIMLPDED